MGILLRDLVDMFVGLVISVGFVGVAILAILALKIVLGKMFGNRRK